MTPSKVSLIDYNDDLFDISQPDLQYMHDVIGAAGGSLEIGQHRTKEGALQAAMDAEVLIVQAGQTIIDESILLQLERCRGVIRAGVGYDSVDVEAATRLGVPVSNVVDWCNEEVAEHAIALLFATALHITSLHEGVVEGSWDREVAIPTFRMRGKTLGLIGFGRIARHMAARVQSFGFELIANDPYVEAVIMAESNVKKVGFDELLARSHYISIHTPLTSNTHHLLDASAFAKMRNGVIIVNTSRGQVIDELALYEAIRIGKVAGIGLDVFEGEPLPTDSPLRGCPNICFTPHVASYSLEAASTLYRLTAEIAANMLRRRWLPTIVNPEVRPLAEARWGPFSD